MTKSRKQIMVRATQEGFFGGSRRRVGSTFYVPEGVLGKWFTPVDETLARKATAALEEAGKAKQDAETEAFNAKVKADQDAADAKRVADQNLKEAKTDIDAKAKEGFFSGLFTDKGDKSATTEQPQGGAEGATSTAPKETNAPGEADDLV